MSGSALAASMTTVAVILFSLDHTVSPGMTGVVTLRASLGRARHPWRSHLLDATDGSRAWDPDDIYAGSALAIIDGSPANSLPPPVLIAIARWQGMNQSMSNSWG